MTRPPNGANRDTVADRMAITTALRRYAYAIDDRDFPTVRGLFTDDARLDYSAIGGPVGTRDEVIEWIEEQLAAVGPTQHLVTNELVDFDGAMARSRCYLLNPLLPPGDARSPVLLLGGEYRDTWRRDPHGWAIVGRIHRVTWQFRLPPG